MYPGLVLLQFNKRIGRIKIETCLNSGGRSRVVSQKHGDPNSSYIGCLAGKGMGTVFHTCANGSIAGGQSVGGLLGMNADTIIHCYADCNISGANEVGGLVGTEFGRIIDCYATSDIEGGTSVGGLIGRHYYQHLMIWG